ncbi:MAG TPA: hypothetical protein VK892_06615 [Pyrinomonadaceae bacterium]|nr:hypothetical protein [Pyrinomonadaceae bacterium]
MFIFKELKNIVLSFSLLLILLPPFIYPQQTPSIDSTVWFLKPQNKKEKSSSVVLFFLKNNEACVMFQDYKGGDLGHLPVIKGKRPIWKQNGSDYLIKFQDRDLVISGKIGNDNSITAVTKGEDNLLESKRGFIGESLKDPKLSYDTRKLLVPFSWLTALPSGKPRWAKEIKGQGLDLCNPLEAPNQQSPWFPPS